MGARSHRLRRASRATAAGLVAIIASFLGAPGPSPAQPPPPAEYAAATWLPASPFDYGRADRPRSGPVTRIVIHVTNLTFGQTIAKFRDPRAGVSAHYVIRSSDGRVVQMVPERDVAWHAGNRLYNATSIGVEHEGQVLDCSWFSDVMYRSSARLVAHLARRYRIPIDRRHIIGHSEVPDPLHVGLLGGAGHHTDPGPCWDWTSYIALVRAAAGPGPRAAPARFHGVTTSRATPGRP